ncbi:hypothetical protein HDU93_005698 [Gonapodya sp. JEL0774]|nr:hypothetical protein HDU93_005698 [Gonapodya sp. JEL0774]
MIMLLPFELKNLDGYALLSRCCEELDDTDSKAGEFLFAVAKIITGSFADSEWVQLVASYCDKGLSVVQEATMVSGVHARTISESFITSLFHARLMGVRGMDLILIEAVVKIRKFGEKHMGPVTALGRALWYTSVVKDQPPPLSFADELAELAVWGPPRDESQGSIESAILRIKNRTSEDIAFRAPSVDPYERDYTELKDLEAKPHVVVSLTQVTLFLMRKIATLPGFLDELCEAVSPWLASHHFTVRIFAQWLIYTTWELLGGNFSQVNSTKSEALEPLVRFLYLNPECQRHRDQFHSDYMLTCFDIEEDLTIDFLFSGFGRLKGYAGDEIIELSAFMRVMQAPSRHVPFVNADRKKRYDEWQKPKINSVAVEDQLPMGNPVQRKGDVWSDLGVDFSTPEASGPEKRVNRNDLPVFLNSKKHDGYTIVGVEQAEGSVMLSEISFPERVILVLGKEKGGIPPTILMLCDILIEIPQFGITRSLNVHVSGSLVIWEFLRQQFGRITG